MTTHGTDRDTRTASPASPLAFRGALIGIQGVLVLSVFAIMHEPGHAVIWAILVAVSLRIAGLGLLVERLLIHCWPMPETDEAVRDAIESGLIEARGRIALAGLPIQDGIEMPISIEPHDRRIGGRARSHAQIDARATAIVEGALDAHLRRALPGLLLCKAVARAFGKVYHGRLPSISNHQMMEIAALVGSEGVRPTIEGSSP